MCFIVSLSILVAGFVFYTKGDATQAAVSFVIGGAIFGVFVYRMAKYKDCIFGKKENCKKS